MKYTALAFLGAIVILFILMYCAPKPCYLVNPDDEGMEVGEPIEATYQEV